MVSETDGTLISRIPLISPYGLDLAPDGKRLYVTSASKSFLYPSAEGFYTVDLPSLQVTDFVQPAGVVAPYNVAAAIAAMRNGKVFYDAKARAITGGTIWQYDPSAGTATSRSPTLYGGNGFMQKSADGSRFILWSNDSNGDLWIYDGSQDAYIAHKAFYAYHPNPGISPDGSRIVVAGNQLLDASFQKIADLSYYGSRYGYFRAASFSVDGSRLYILSEGDGTAGFSVVTVLDGSSGAVLGYVPGPVTLATGGGIAVGSKGLAVVLCPSGFATLDLSRPNLGFQVPDVDGQFTFELGYPKAVTPPVGSLTAPAPTVINGHGYADLPDGMSAYFGSQPGTNPVVQSKKPLKLQVQPPSSTTAGPVDVAVEFSNGWVAYGPEAYSYGPTILAQDIDAGGTEGGTTVILVGYGFDDSTQPKVMVGGVSATVTNVRLYPEFIPYYRPIEYVYFTTPPGVAGNADITVTTAYGTTTRKNGFRYLARVEVPNVQPIQMLLDEGRGRLYAADAATGSVKSIDLATQAVSTLLASKGAPASALALTPDRTRLLVLSAQGRRLTVVDLASGGVLKTLYPSPSESISLERAALAATSRGTALVVLGSSEYDGLNLWEIDLAGGHGTNLGSLADDANQSMAASADGSRVYIASTRISDGVLATWDAATDAVSSETAFLGYVGRISTTDAGDRVLIYTDSYVNSTLVSTTTYSDLEELKIGAVSGEKLHSNGGLQYLPSDKGVLIYDVPTGTRLLSVGIPGGVADVSDGLCINRAGDTLYAASANGIEIVSLVTAPLSIGRVAPSTGSATGGGTVTLYGSGFRNGTTVTAGGQSAIPNVLDSTRLTFVMPPIAAAKVGITVQNPDGTVYTLPAAYDATFYPSAPTPVLTGIAPTTAVTGDSITISLSGSGFIASSQVFLNGYAVETVYSSATTIQAKVRSLPGPGVDTFTVVNPSPGGASNRLNLTVKNPDPRLDFLTPSTAVAGPSELLVKLQGNGFNAQSVALWNGSAISTTFVNGQLLLVRLGRCELIRAGSNTIAVRNPLADADTTGSIKFTVTPAALSITRPPAVGGCRVNRTAP